MSRTPLSLHTSGLQPDVGRLGGDVDLKHILVLKVKTSQAVPLKGMVYNIYDGCTWLTTRTPSYRFMGDTEYRLDDAFDLTIPHNEHGDNPLEDAMPSVDTKVTMIFGGYSIYASGRVSYISPANNLFYNIRSEIFSERHLSTRFTYQYTSTLFNKSAKDIDSRIWAIDKASSQKNSILYDSGYDAAASEYLQLPSELPNSVSDYAHMITDNCTTPFARMKALEKYLKNNFDYTLSPGSVPPGEDFVDYFLKTKQGYCTYFASAMAVMARTLGVPSRFVIGYGLVKDGKNFEAYTDNAHAWVECYFRGVGWVNFDPTAGSGYSPPVKAKPASPAQANQSASNVSSGKTTTTATTTTTTTRKATTSTKAAPPVRQNGNPLLWTAIAAGIILLMLSAAGSLRVIRNKKAYVLDNVKLRFSENGARADYYYTDLLRQLELMNQKIATGETIRQYGRRISKEFNTDTDGKETNDGDLILSAFETIMNLRYGEIMPSDEEIAGLSDIHDILEKRLQKTLTPVSYFMIRLLLA